MIWVNVYVKSYSTEQLDVIVKSWYMKNNNYAIDKSGQLHGY